MSLNSKFGSSKKHPFICSYKNNATQSDTLEQLVNSATWATQSDEQENSTSTSVAMNTALMWKILDYAAPRGDTWRGKGIFRSTSMATARSKTQHEQTTISEPQTDRAAAVEENSFRIMGTSPDWFKPVPPSSSKPIEATWQISERRATNAQHEIENAGPGTTASLELPELANWYWTEDPSNETFMDVANDPMSHFYDRDSSNSAWWDFGDL